MIEIRPKRPPVRLDAKAYRDLCKGVLERNGWRCQSCGSLSTVEFITSDSEAIKARMPRAT